MLCGQVRSTMHPIEEEPLHAAVPIPSHVIPDYPSDTSNVAEGGNKARADRSDHRDPIQAEEREDADAFEIDALPSQEAAPVPENVASNNTVGVATSEDTKVSIADRAFAPPRPDNAEEREDAGAFEIDALPTQEAAPVPENVASNNTVGVATSEDTKVAIAGRAFASPRPDNIASNRLATCRCEDTEARGTTRSQGNQLPDNSAIQQAAQEGRSPTRGLEVTENSRDNCSPGKDANIQLLGKPRKRVKQSKRKSRFTAADILGTR